MEEDGNKGDGVTSDGGQEVDKGQRTEDGVTKVVGYKIKNME